MIRDMKSGKSREVAPGFDRSPTALAWSADGTVLYAVAEDIGQTRIFAINPTSGAANPLTGDGHVGGLDVAGNAVIFSRDALNSPAQVYELVTGGAARQLTHVGEDSLAQTSFSDFEQFSFARWNGETVHGYIVKPADYKPGRKYPVAFLIHGGPYGSFGNAWSYRWNPQVWAGMGYAVVMIDFHGSSGYGEAFAKSIIAHWGNRPLEDLQKGWAYALTRYPYLDGDRACALGGSYGGYMVSWIAGNWAKPWKCLVDHDGVFDIRLMSYFDRHPRLPAGPGRRAELGQPGRGGAVQSDRPCPRTGRRRSWSCTAGPTTACPWTRAWAPMARPSSGMCRASCSISRTRTTSCSSRRTR